jgi:hypothetical protein
MSGPQWEPGAPGVARPSSGAEPPPWGTPDAEGDLRIHVFTTDRSPVDIDCDGPDWTVQVWREDPTRWAWYSNGLVAVRVVWFMASLLLVRGRFTLLGRRRERRAVADRTVVGA